MGPDEKAGAAASVDGHGARSATALFSLIGELERILLQMDAEGLSLAANHVSRGLELLREEADSLQGG